MANTITDFKPIDGNARSTLVRARQLQRGDLTGIPQSTITKRNLTTEAGRVAYIELLVKNAKAFEENRQW